MSIIHVYSCAHVGIAGTTDVHARQNPDGQWEARVGIAIMGMTNMRTDEEWERCQCNPFHDLFHDNYAQGFGATEEAAIEAMRADMKSMSDGLWA